MLYEEIEGKTNVGKPQRVLGEKFAKKMAEKNPGMNLGQKLIEMRYEQ